MDVLKKGAFIVVLLFFLLFSELWPNVKNQGPNKILEVNGSQWLGKSRVMLMFGFTQKALKALLAGILEHPY